jgi:hypothetical protein
MIYLLLIIPHLVAIAGLLAYAVRSSPFEESNESQDGSFGQDGKPPPPSTPPPTPSPGFPGVPREVSPRRRIRDARRHSKLHARRPRREHPTRRPNPAPKADIGAQAP